MIRPTDARAMEQFVATMANLQPTYSELGRSLSGEWPTGYRNNKYEMALGSGLAVFHRAVQGLGSWHAHDLPGVRVFPKAEDIRSGDTVVVTLGTPFLALAAPCRIIEIVNETNRWGFAYGTLPGHPEQGEEAFVVSIDEDDRVRFTITAFSRPGDLVTRIAGPLGRAIQQRGTRGYLCALQRYVDQPQSQSAS